MADIFMLDTHTSDGIELLMSLSFIELNQAPLVHSSNTRSTVITTETHNICYHSSGYPKQNKHVSKQSLAYTFISYKSIQANIH